MNLKYLNYALAIFIALGIVSCSDDDTSSPTKNASLTLKAGSGQLKTASELTISKAVIHVEEVEFESLEQNDDDFEIDFKGTFKIDLLTGKSTPNIPTSYLQAGKYEEVEVELNEDIDVNLLINGTISSVDNEPINFEFYCNEDFEFEAEGKDTASGYLFEVVEGQDVNIVMEFNIEEWFTGIDITSGTPTNGVIIISKTSNTELYAQIIKHINQEKLIVYNAN